MCNITCLTALPILAPNLPVVSKIRETMVRMFAGSVFVQHSDSGDYSTTDQHLNTIIPADSQFPVDPSICVFWSVVALGALVKGRPIESVRDEQGIYC